jgi:hypothetical protein
VGKDLGITDGLCNTFLFVTDGGLVKVGRVPK